MCIALPSIGVIGLGIMGLPIARHLCDAGYSVTVFNRTASRSEDAKSFGAYIAPSVRHLGERMDILITMLSTPDAVSAVIDGENGALAHPKSGLVWIQMSTLDIQSTHGFAKIAESKGVIFVDCPVSGSKKAVESADLVLLVGSPSEALDYVRPLLMRLGKNIIHAGPVGAGTALKLTSNLLVAQMTTALVEAVALARAAEIDPQRLFDLIQVSPTLNSGYFKMKKDPLLTNQFPTAFSVKNMAKDIRFMDEEASRRGLTLSVTQAVRGVFEKAIAAGFGQEDLSAISKLFKSQPS